MRRAVKALLPLFVLLPLLVLPSGCIKGQRGMGLGDFYFNHGWYLAAQRQYLAVARKDPRNILAWASAGLAASARDEGLQSYRIFREGTLANRHNLLLPLVGCEVMGYGDGIPVLADQITTAQERFLSLAGKHRLPGEIMDPMMPTDLTGSDLEGMFGPKRLEVIDRLQPKEDAGAATEEELLMLGVAYGTGARPDWGRAAQYLDRAVKKVPRSVVGQYQRIITKRVLAHLQLWDMMAHPTYDRKAGQKALEPLLAAVHEALVDLPNNYVPLLGLRNPGRGLYLYEFCAPWARGAAKQHPKSAVAQFLAAYTMTCDSRLNGFPRKGWDTRAVPYLESAVKLAPGWQRPPEVLDVIVRAEKMRLDAIRTRKVRAEAKRSEQ